MGDPVIKATHLLYADDFTSYTSDADIVAAYPSAFTPGDDTYDEQATDWGATYGPDGQPGIKDQVSGAARDSGAITKDGLNPNGREFRVLGRWNFAATNHILTTHFAAKVEYDSNTFFLSKHWQLNHNHNTGTLTIVIRTTPAYGNVLSNNFYSTDLPGVAPSGTPMSVEVKWRQSELTETSPGVFTPSTDGRVELWLDGVEVVVFDGPVWGGDSSFGLNPQWNRCDIDTIGAFAAWEIWDEPNPLSGSDDSIPSCCDEPDGGGGGDVGTNPNPVGTLPPWMASCTGGGLVDGVADLADGESWL